MIEQDKKLLYWLPVLIWLEFIFLLSSIPSAVLPQMASADSEFWAHRTSHIIEYAILGILLIRAYTHKKTKIDVTAILYMSVYVLLSALFDEWHQSFVPGRHAQWIDVNFDTICAAGGMLIYLYYFKSKRRRQHHFFGKVPK